MPYRYSSHPCACLPLSGRLLNHSSRTADIPGSSLLSVTPPSCGPRIISLSSFILFSPAMYFAYSARNSAFWLNPCRVFDEVPEFTCVPLFALPLPVCFTLAAGEAVGCAEPLGREPGRKTAAHRSYSLQSKYVFARRNLCASRASNCASTASLELRPTGVRGGGASDMGESTSVSEPSSSGGGSELRSSAALKPNQ
jgi:hypothetical protein